MLKLMKILNIVLKEGYLSSSQVLLTALCAAVDTEDSPVVLGGSIIPRCGSNYNDGRLKGLIFQSTFVLFQNLVSEIFSTYL